MLTLTNTEQPASSLSTSKGTPAQPARAHFSAICARALSCVDGSFYARVNLSDFDICRLRSCVQSFDAVDITAGLDKVRT